MRRSHLPFRLGTTSYIVPDAILPNVAFLAGRVQDIELVLFESGDVSNLPGPAEIEALNGWRRKADLTYTVHLPLDATLGSADETARKRGVTQCLRVLELTRPLEPFARIVHLDGRQRGDRPADDLGDWLRTIERSIDGLLETGIAPAEFCVETLDYPFDLVEPLVRRKGLSVCLDIGHLLMRGRDVKEHFARYGNRCRVVHLHGIREGKDHRDVAALDSTLLKWVLSRLAAPDAPKRVLTLEVFGQEDFEASMKCLAGLL